MGAVAEEGVLVVRMGFMALQNLMLFVRDLPAMQQFYTEVLGLAPLAEAPREGYVRLNAGGVILSLHAIPAHIAREFEISVPPVPREDSPFKLIFSVSEPEALRRKLESLSLPILERPWGGWDFSDPEGNVLSVQF